MKTNWPESDMPPTRSELIPRHGDRGDAVVAEQRFPRTLTIAISREAGARGASIAKRIGQKLGWQVIDQDLMEYIAQKGGADDDLSARARSWAEARLQQLLQEGVLSGDPHATAMARVVLTLGALGEVVLVGRGAGHVLPRENRLHVRVVAPRSDRIAYLAQLLRLTPGEAEKQLEARDTGRHRYLLDHFSVEASDPIHYDLVINSSLLGEELCAEIVVQAAKAKILGADLANGNSEDAA